MDKYRINKERAAITILLLLLLGSCSIGPIEVTHQEGELPKLHVETPSDACKVRGKLKEVKVACEWPVDF